MIQLRSCVSQPKLRAGRTDRWRRWLRRVCWPRPTLRRHGMPRAYVWSSQNLRRFGFASILCIVFAIVTGVAAPASAPWRQVVRGDCAGPRRSADGLAMLRACAHARTASSEEHTWRRISACSCGRRRLITCTGKTQWWNTERRSVFPAWWSTPSTLDRSAL